MICRDNNISLTKFVERTFAIEPMVLDTFEHTLCVFVEMSEP